jgi:hypothetical protein
MKDAEEVLARGARADTIMNDPLFKSSVTLVKASLIEKFQDTLSGIFGRKERDEIHRQLNSLDAVIGILEREMADGKLAAEAIKREKAIQEKTNKRKRR